ncbi:hypothetical protein C8Q78DRAFT_990991 [Trametes maxima]|nr:hypothetical protein C8Q78DRAFT_990991 [Trametes maxima]
METTKKCSNCKAERPINKFRPRVKGVHKGEPTAVCGRCMDKQNEARRARRDAKRAREEGGSDEGPGEEVEDGTHHLGEMSAEEFLDAIIHIEAPYLVRARVNVEAIAPKGRNSEMRKRADKVVKAIGEVLFLHWSYEKRYKHKRQVSETLTFSCAQSADREQNPKVPKGPKPRDTRRMERFQCHGWLHLTVSAESDVIEVSLKHREHHKPYKDIELPEEWKTFIKDHARIMSPSQIWNHIVAKEMAGKSVLTPGTALPFRQKAVYYYWQCEGRKDWRLANTPFRSAEKWLEEKGEQHHVKCLPIEPEPGTEVLAFYVTDFCEAWSAHTQELAMDSTCEPRVTRHLLPIGF